ncbi:MAG: hybrid sensor histidine kinase/response regulator [Lachnospiraceae bacterium]
MKKGNQEAENLALEQAINGIIDMTDIALKNMEDPDRIRDCLGKISSSCTQMLTLINDAKAINRPESGKGIITKTPMDIHRVLQDCADSVKDKVEKKEVVFTVQDENILHSYLLGDKEKLYRILDNILDNAIKVTPRGGIVSFRATEIESNEKIAVIRFEIQDNEVAMEDETFIVTLSFDIDNIEKTEETDKKDSDLAGMKVLLAEDNELNMEIIQYELEELGASVVCASHGQAAVDIFAKSAEQTFDAILMDVMMPVMDGIRAAELIRGFDRKDAEKIPIIAMTASICTEDIKGFQKAGIQAYLEKPIEPAALYEILAPYKRGMEYEN